MNVLVSSSEAPAQQDDSVVTVVDANHEGIDDDVDKELQQLADEAKGEEASSPPPTMDESMSERGSPIVAPMVVTLKPLSPADDAETANESMVMKLK